MREVVGSCVYRSCWCCGCALWCCGVALYCGVVVVSCTVVVTIVCVVLWCVMVKRSAVRCLVVCGDWIGLVESLRIGLVFVIGWFVIGVGVCDCHSIVVEVLVGLLSMLLTRILQSCSYSVVSYWSYWLLWFVCVSVWIMCVFGSVFGWLSCVDCLVFGSVLCVVCCMLCCCCVVVLIVLSCVSVGVGREVVRARGVLVYHTQTVIQYQQQTVRNDK